MLIISLRKLISQVIILLIIQLIITLTIKQNIFLLLILYKLKKFKMSGKIYLATHIVILIIGIKSPQNMSPYSDR